MMISAFHWSIRKVGDLFISLRALFIYLFFIFSSYFSNLLLSVIPRIPGIPGTPSFQIPVPNLGERYIPSENKM